MSDSNQESTQLSLVDHLAELRFRLIRSIYGLILTTAVSYNYSDQIFAVVRKPIEKYLTSGGLIFTHPIDKFMAHLKLSIVCGLILSCPIWLYHVWKFVSPGLYSNEKKYMGAFILSGTSLFLMGVGFAYFIALPMAFEFLMTFGGSVDKPMISIGEYLGFFSQVCLMFGAAFELPVILVILGLMGIVNKSFLSQNRRYAILAIAIVAAIITPPDLFSMLMMLIPMTLLYELSVLIIGLIEKKREVSSVSE